MLKIENKEGVVLAFLNNLTEAKVYEVINGEYTLSFIATVDSLKTDYLYDYENLINYDEDLFRVVTIEELHNEDDNITLSVVCEHISYDLINTVFSDFNYTYRTGNEVMIECLRNTGFTLRNCTVRNKTDIQYTQECNAKQISLAIAHNWKGELKYYRYYIDFLERRGADRGTGFTFGKNLKSVKRIINRAENTTSWEVEIVEGSELEELGYYELGDTVRIADERLNLDTTSRIIEIEKDVLTGMNSKVVLGDKIKDIRSEFARNKEYTDAIAEETSGKIDDLETKSQPYWDKLNSILNNLGNVLADKIQGDLSLATTSILNSTGTFFQRDNNLYWQDQPTKEASTFASMWNSNGIMFANSKDENGEWIWQSALNATGLVANQVTTNCLNAIQATILNLVVGTIKGKEIEAVTINGSTIKGNMVVADDAKISGLEVGKNITMGANATISWNNVTEQPTIPTIPSYIQSTKIDGTGIQAPTITGMNITGNTITGGTISGTTVSGSTLISGTRESGNYLELDNSGNMFGYKNGEKVFVIWVQQTDLPQIEFYNGRSYLTIGPAWAFNKLQFGIHAYGGDIDISCWDDVNIHANKILLDAPEVKFTGRVYDRTGTEQFT